MRLIAAACVLIALCAACASESTVCCQTIETGNAKPYAVGEPIPWEWQLGSATTTVHRHFWRPGPNPTSTDAVLVLHIQVAALTGEADFDIENWSALTADGQLVRPDAAGTPNSPPELTWKRFAAGDSHQAPVTFTIPYGPTEVYFTILGERLAVYSIAVDEPISALSTGR